MKTITFLLLLIGVTLKGFSGQDSTTYYAASRLNFYTNEEIGEIMVYVPERLSGSRITTDLVFEYEFLIKGYEVIPGEVMTVPFPLNKLREGENEITVSFYENEKWVDSRKVWLTVRPHRENAVRIDLATGGLVADGMPLFPFGFFTWSPVEEGQMEQEALNGFNFISPYQQLDKKTRKARKAYMDLSADLGLRVNYNLCSVAGGAGKNEFKAPVLSAEEKMERLRKEVELYRDHPALLSWYIAEEPDNRGFSPDSLKRIYEIVKELDPYHPVCVLLASPRQTEAYRHTADIIMTNPYPVPQGKVGEVKEFTRIIRQNYWLEKPVWLVAQAFGGNGWWQREPTAAEARAMTYLGIIHGATGIQYFIREGRNSFPKSPVLWSECSKMALELAEIAPDILSPHPAPKIVTQDSGIYARAWNRAGLVTIVVANELNEPAEFHLQMKDVDITVMGEALFENRRIKVNEGSISDMIDAYGTRVYRIDARDKIARVKEPVTGNLTTDPGFEDLSCYGVPAACFAYPGEDPGSTYFIDSRRHYQGEHSLRLNNPADKAGTELSFYEVNLAADKTYTISVVARTGASPNRPSAKKGKPLGFRLELGQQAKEFSVTDTWEHYEIKGIRFEMTGQDNRRVSPKLRILGKGTIWFDMLQVYPE